MPRPGASTRASAEGQRVTAGTAWLSAAERGSLLGMYFIVWCHRIFGRRLCALMIVPVVGYFFVTGRAARRASRGYLARVHRWAEGRGGDIRRPGWRDSFRHFHEFALNIIDRISFFVGDTREFEMVVHGREHLERLVGAGRGALVLSAHLGSFDALRVVADEGGVPLNVAMFLRNARMINAVFARLNPSRPLRIIDLERAAPHSVFEIRACLQRGEFVGMLADRVGVGDGARVSWVTFFGERAAIPQGPFLLASALKCPVILMIGLRIDHRRYEVFVETLSDEVAPAPDALARHYVSRLEHYCLRAPYQWFNFYEFWDGPAPSPV
jgi:predicted LPLAT superfamily acyltransferase